MSYIVVKQIELSCKCIYLKRNVEEMTSATLCSLPAYTFEITPITGPSKV